VKRTLWCIILSLAWVRLLPQSQPIQASSPEAARILLEHVRSAAGGEVWNSIREIQGEGSKVSFGLTGDFHSTEQIETGFFSREAKYSLFSNAEGLDSNGRWRLDNSGQIHNLDSAEAKAVAVSEAYISARGYLFVDSSLATVRLCDMPANPESTCISVLPKGGREMSLWINSKTYLVERIEMPLSVGSESFSFADYRRVDGIFLPFEITVNHGDESESGVARLSNYRISRADIGGLLKRPQLTTTDISIDSGSEEATVHGFLDKESGFFIIEAKVNGQGPYPFILDTGGHDILTPGMTHRLGLKAAGQGFSTGAGAGTTPTEFTTVSSLSMGGTTVIRQPFTILHIDLGTAEEKGKRVPIAGILGLEIFERFAVTMDYKAEKVTLRPADRYLHQGRGVAVPLVFTSDMPLCEAKIDGHSGVFGIDTGNNTDVIIFHAWAVANGIGQGSSNDEMNGSSVGGELKLGKGRIQRFTIGGFELGATDALFSSDTSGSLSARSEGGNLGNSILSRFVVTFNFRSGTMYLDQPF
jgi:predicted aspartyl protease